MQYVSNDFSHWNGSNIPDESVDLDRVNVIKLFQCLLDLPLVGLDVNDEHQSIVLLNLLHCTLSIERVNDNLVLIKTRLVGNGFSWVLWLAGELKGLRSVEGGREADLPYFMRVLLIL